MVSIGRGNTALMAILVLGLCIPICARAQAPPPAGRSTPEPAVAGLQLGTARAADTLSVTAGQPTRLRLNLPELGSWTTANIGHFVVRTYAIQESIAPTPAPGKDYVEYTFDEPGLALILLAAGPASEKGKSDSWQRTTHCTKLIVRVEPDPAAENAAPAIPPDPGLAGKVGHFTEIRPLVSPASLVVGRHLPVRVYCNGGKQADSEVAAHRPDGSVETKRTDPVGITNFAITQPGRWIIRYTKDLNGTTYTGDLVFDVPAEVGEKGGQR